MYLGFTEDVIGCQQMFTPPGDLILPLVFTLSLMPCIQITAGVVHIIDYINMPMV
jgi:hypothetical protein